MEYSLKDRRLMRRLPACLLRPGRADDQLGRIGQRGDPVTEHMPLGELVAASRMVHIAQVFIVHRHRAELVVARRQQLNQIVPPDAVAALGIAAAKLFEVGDIALEARQAFSCLLYTSRCV